MIAAELPCLECKYLYFDTYCWRLNHFLHSGYAMACHSRFCGYPDFPLSAPSRFRHTLNRLLAPIHDRITKHIVSLLPSIIAEIESSPRRILEIGIARGEGAKLIIKAAKRVGATGIEYYGFDLFEISEMEKVKARLEKTGVTARLFKGDSRETLPRAVGELPKMDFILIDGGHSYDVVKSDWKHVQELMHERTVVVFDDYRRTEGVTRIVDEIDKGIFNIKPVPVRHIQPIPPSVHSYIGMAIVTKKIVMN